MSWHRPNIGSRVTREGHARFWERPEVKFLRATRQPEETCHRNNTAGLPSRAELLTDGRHSWCVPRADLRPRHLGAHEIMRHQAAADAIAYLLSQRDRRQR